MEREGEEEDEEEGGEEGEVKSQGEEQEIYCYLETQFGDTGGIAGFHSISIRSNFQCS